MHIIKKKHLWESPFLHEAWRRVSAFDADSKAQGIDPSTMPRKVLPVVSGGHPPASPCDTDLNTAKASDPYELVFLVAAVAPLPVR